MEEAKKLHEETGQVARIFKDFRYRTLNSWSCERRVVGKAEYLNQGANPRFVVTSLGTEFQDKDLYEKIYCTRGEMENRIKEQRIGTDIFHRSFFQLSAALKMSHIPFSYLADVFRLYSLILIHKFRQLSSAEDQSQPPMHLPDFCRLAATKAADADSSPSTSGMRLPLPCRHQEQTQFDTLTSAIGGNGHLDACLRPLKPRRNKGRKQIDAPALHRIPLPQQPRSISQKATRIPQGIAYPLIFRHIWAIHRPFSTHSGAFLSW